MGADIERAPVDRAARPDPETPAARPARVFISYSRKDLVFVDALDAALRERGIETLVDRSEIYAFEDWWARIQGLIAEADTVLFVLSPDSIVSPICLKEVTFAETLNKRFAPVVAKAVDIAQVPGALSRLNFIHLDGPNSLSSGIDRLNEALSTDIGWVRQHTGYGELAHRWSAAGRPPALLLRSPQLEEAERWIAGRPAHAPVPTEETQALVVGSRRAAMRRRTLLSAGLAMGLVVALLLASVAFWQRHRAIEAQQAEAAQRGVAETQTQLALRREAEAQRERDRATLAETEAVTQRNAAQRNFEVARTTIDSVIADLVGGLQRVEGLKLSVLGTVLTRVRTAVDRLSEAAPDNLDLQASRAAMLVSFGDTYLLAGDGAAASRAYGDALVIERDLVRREPANASLQRELSVALNKIGDAAMPSGDIAAALLAYEEGLAITRALAGAKPDDQPLQRDLAFSLTKIAMVRLKAGEAANAKLACEEALAIASRFARLAPGDTEWQRALVVARITLGDIAAQAGDAKEAVAQFEEALEISRELVVREPDNTERRHDLAVLLVRLGDFARQTGDLPAAEARYRDGLGIVRDLARRDPEHAVWENDVALILTKIGDLRLAAGDRTEAVSHYREALVIRRALARRDPNNAGWQIGLARSLVNDGDMKLDADDMPGALQSYQEGLTIVRALSERDSAQAERKHELATVLSKIAAVKLRQDDDDGAIAAHRESLVLFRSLAQEAPENLAWQLELVQTLLTLVSLTDDLDDKKVLLTEALAVVTRLERRGPLPDGIKALPGTIRTLLDTP